MLMKVVSRLTKVVCSLLISADFFLSKTKEIFKRICLIGSYAYGGHGEKKTVFAYKGELLLRIAVKVFSYYIWVFLI